MSRAELLERASTLPSPVGSENGVHLRENGGVLLSSVETYETTPTTLFQGRVLVGEEPVDWTLEVPEQLRYNGIAIFVPGYMGIKQSSRKPRNALANEGIAALSYSPSRGGGESRLVSLKDPQLLHVETLRLITANLVERQDEIVKTVPNGNLLDFQRFILVLHSMGGLAGPRFALQEAGKVEMLVGYATVGFGHPTLQELLKDIPTGLGGSIQHELIPAFTMGAIELSLRNMRDFIRYYARLRVISEGISCLTGNVLDEVEKLDDRGVPYHYYGFGKDILVRPDQTVSEYVTSYSLLDRYGHLAPQVKARKVAKEMAAMVLAA